MHTRTVLQKLLHYSFPSVHRKRLTAVQIAVDSINDGAAVSITTMGRHLASGVRIKHRIKRMDRLVGNPLLCAEWTLFYCPPWRLACIWCASPSVVATPSVRRVYDSI